MTPRRALTLALELVVVVVIVSLLVGQLLGQPVLLSYVETGSMSPTMEPGDGFVAVPSAVAGEVGTGDVVVFRAQEVGGGGLTTHRVVGETADGYITQGDANPFTDQDGDEPPVQEAQIVAVAWSVGGGVVVIPELGTVVMGIQGVLAGAQRWVAATLGTRSLLGTQGVTYILVALSAVGYVVDWLLDDGEKGRERDTSRTRDGLSSRLLLLGLAAVLVVSATAAMAVPAGTQEFGVVSAEFESERPTVIEQGTSSTIEYRAPNAGLVPMYVAVEPASDGVDVADRWLRVPGRGEATTTVTITAPPETGYYTQYVVEHRYLAILPSSVVRTLAAVHPWLPVVVIDAIFAFGVFGLGRLLLDDGRLRIRRRQSRHSSGSWRRAFRRLYR
jgi:signal peptidase